MKAGIIFPVKYSEWVSNLVPIRKAIGHIRLCVDFHAVKRAIMIGYSPFPNIEMILQQVAGSQMTSILDGFSGYNQIKVKREDKYKPTLLRIRVPLLMSVFLLSYLMQVPLFKELCK